MGTKHRRNTHWGVSWGTVTLIGILLAASAFMGCSSDNPVTATQQTDQDNEWTLDDRREAFIQADSALGMASKLAIRGRDAIEETPLVLEDADSVGVCASSEGEMELVLAGDTATLTVPEGAVENCIMITVDGSKVWTTFGWTYVYDCGPDGTSFDQPIRLVQEMDKPDGYLAAMYYDHPTKGWVRVETCAVTDGKAYFEIDHFSKYGIN